MDRQRALKPIPNCPNCGAPIQGLKCEYCGTTFSVNDVNSPTVGDVINQYIDDDIRRLEQEIVHRRFELEQAQFAQNIVSAIHAQNAFQQTNLVTSRYSIY